MINTGGSGSGSSVDASKLTGNYKIIFEFLVGKGLNAAPHVGYAQILKENLMEILLPFPAMDMGLLESVNGRLDEKLQ